MVESCTTLFLKVKLREFYTISILQDITSKISFRACAPSTHGYLVQAIVPVISLVKLHMQ